MRPQSELKPAPGFPLLALMAADFVSTIAVVRGGRAIRQVVWLLHETNEARIAAQARCSEVNSESCEM
jgi:hypothetical protein